ncbi:PTS mannose transporter subunit IIA [Loigolactobacillus backii]|uniref:PTS sugar transporter subunit IIA n=1 Tax=Loigolactobacillus backii TaxID=375175 RepID=UPI000C1C9610|nr:PTS sugar transporter subunit IIA [Loigolactobacillus backii]PIO83999.1 PTS mannose transporter subunit IIA [Loigolactobacillus backii]
MLAIIIASHGKFSEGILQSSQMIFGEQDLVKAITFMPDEGPDDLMDKFQTTIESFGADDQILFLVDLFGGSPFNTASRIVAEDLDRYALVTGVNLPMLLEAYNVRDKPLAAVVTHLEETARAGVKHLDLTIFQE